MQRLPIQGYALIAGQSISTFGDYAARTALMLFILDKTGSAYDVGVMMIMNSIPAILGVSSIYFSRRFELTKLLIVYSLISAALSLAMNVFTGQFWNLVGINFIYFLMALMNSLYVPTRLALVPHFVSKDILKPFNSLDQTLEAIMMSAGIVAAGYLYIFLGIEWVFVINAISFMIIAATIKFAFTNGFTESLSLSKKVRQGKGIFNTLTFMKNHPDVFFLTIGVGISGLAVGIISTVFVIFIRRDLGGTAVDFSHISSLRALASSVLGLAFAFSWLRISDRMMVIAGYISMGVAVIAMTLSSQLWLVFVWNFIIGAANVLYYIGVRTLLQKSGGDFKTDLFALQSAIMRFSMVAASGVSGLLIDRAGLRSTWELYFAGSIFIITGIWGWISLRARSTGLPNNDLPINS